MDSVLHQIRVSERTFDRLKKLAEPFVDQPDDVIQRLLDQNDSSLGQNIEHATPSSSPRHEAKSPILREPRERGATVQIGDTEINAVSLRALYDQALRLFVERHGPKLKSVVPIKTSAKRYLIALQPFHPTGKSFVKPVEFRGFFMESHKDYKNGLAHLRILCNRLGLNLKYLR